MVGGVWSAPGSVKQSAKVQYAIKTARKGPRRISVDQDKCHDMLEFPSGRRSESEGRQKDGPDLVGYNGKQNNRQPSLGLEAHRQSAGVTLEQIAEATKISRRFLKAIEDGCYKELPGGVFTTSYIRQYAAAVGFNADLILKHYERSLSPEEPMAGKKPLARQEAGLDPSLSKWANRFFSIG